MHVNMFGRCVYVCICMIYVCAIYEYLCLCVSVYERVCFYWTKQPIKEDDPDIVQKGFLGAASSLDTPLSEVFSK